MIHGKQNLSWIDTVQKIPDLDKKSLRNFGLMMGGFFLLIFGLAFPFLSNRSYPVWPWVFAAIMCVWALTVPTGLKPVYYAWMRIGLVIGGIVNRIILGIVFYGLILPMSIVMRLIRRDPMAQKLDKDAKTYRIKSRIYIPKDMERPF